MSTTGADHEECTLEPSSFSTCTTFKPKSQHVSPGHKHSSTDVQSTQVPSKTPRVGEIYTLSDFLKNYKQLLPLRIQVADGFCGKEERSVISTGDIYNFHFIKNEKFMTIQDDEGLSLSIPVSLSSVTCGLLYDPIGDAVRAKRGYTFKTIGELASFDSHPKVLKAAKSFNSGNQESSVVAEETLIIKKVAKGPDVNQPFINAFSLLSREEKTLYKDCEGHFTTDPNSVQLQLNDIVKFLGECLPLKAALFLNFDIIEERSEKITHLDSEVVTLERVKTEPSLVATTCWDGEEGTKVSPNPECDHVPLTLPVDLKISVTLFKK